MSLVRVYVLSIHSIHSFMHLERIFVWQLPSEEHGLNFVVYNDFSNSCELLSLSRIKVFCVQKIVISINWKLCYLPLLPARENKNEKFKHDVAH